MRKIALIDLEYDIEFDSRNVTDININSISEWREVSDEEYWALRNYSRGKFRIVEFIEKEIFDEYLELAMKEMRTFQVAERKEEERKEKRKLAAKEAKKKREDKKKGVSYEQTKT